MKNLILILLILSTRPSFAIDLLLIGDSIVAAYPYPERKIVGWGVPLKAAFEKFAIKIQNKAVGGTTTETYFDTYWSKAHKLGGQYLFLQFGHNDAYQRATSPSTYRWYLKKYLAESLEKERYTIFVTPPVRYQYSSSGQFNSSDLDPYVEQMRILAREKNIPLIDLNAESKKFFNGIGPADAKKYFSMYPVRPNVYDITHYNALGADWLANQITQKLCKFSVSQYPQIKELKSALAKPCSLLK